MPITLPNRPQSPPRSISTGAIFKWQCDLFTFFFLSLGCQRKNWLCHACAATRNVQLFCSLFQLGWRQGWRKCWLRTGWALRGAATLQTSSCRASPVSSCGKSLLGFVWPWRWRWLGLGSVAGFVLCGAELLLAGRLVGIGFVYSLFLFFPLELHQIFKELQVRFRFWMASSHKHLKIKN